MGEISKEAAYLKGLAEGMGISDKTNEGKLMAKLIEVFEKAAQKIDKLESDGEEFNTDIDSIYDELYENAQNIKRVSEAVKDFVNGNFYDEDDEDDEDDDDLFGLYDDDDDDLFEIMCPECGEDVVVDFDMLDEDNNIVCPNCHKSIELEFDMDDEDEKDED